MISTKEKVVTSLVELNDTQLQTVAEFTSLISLTLRIAGFRPRQLCR